MNILTPKLKKEKFTMKVFLQVNNSSNKNNNNNSRINNNNNNRIQRVSGSVYDLTYMMTAREH